VDGGEPVGKLIDVKVFGSKGALFFGGDDSLPSSGALELRRRDTGGRIEKLHDEFLFENCDDEGLGPESVRIFVEACRTGAPSFAFASAAVGLQTVRVIDAMYRSHAAGGMPTTVA